jgi:hypothetical protein
VLARVPSIKSSGGSLGYGYEPPRGPGCLDSLRQARPSIYTKELLSMDMNRATEVTPEVEQTVEDAFLYHPWSK